MNEQTNVRSEATIRPRLAKRVMAVVSSLSLVVGLLLGFASAPASAAPPLGNQWAQQTTTADTEWRTVVWGGPTGDQKFVAVGVNGVMTSLDGVSWTSQDVPANNWMSVVWAAGKFVAVSSSGANSVMTSVDGETWTQPSVAPPLGFWRSVTWGNGLFVAVGDNQPGRTNQLMTSPDGESWTIRTPAGGVTVVWQSVTWGGPVGQEKFVAVASSGAGGTDWAMTSTNGTAWTGRSVTKNQWKSVVWGGDKFVAVAQAGANRAMTSADGETWTLAPSAPPQAGWQSVTWGGPVGAEKYVAVANVTVGGPGFNVMTSDNGTSWSIQNSGLSLEWLSVAWGGETGNQGFVATSRTGGDSGLGGVMRTTLDPSAASVSIAGTATVGATLTATANDVSGVPVPTLTWEWRRSLDGADWQAIPDATAASYVVDTADEGYLLQAQVVATNTVSGSPVGSTTVDSDATARVPTPPGPTPSPTPTPSPSPSPSPTPHPGTLKNQSANCLSGLKGSNVLPRRGSRVMVAAGCKTNAGKRVGVRMSLGRMSRGEQSYRIPRLRCVVRGNKSRSAKRFKAKRSKGYSYCVRGALVVQARGLRVQTKIKWHATVAPGYLALNKSRSFRMK